MTKNKITEGNAFSLCIKQAVWVDERKEIIPINASDLEDVHLYIGKGPYRAHAIEYSVMVKDDLLIAYIDHTLKVGVYSTWITAIYNGRRVASNCQEAFEIVSFDEKCLYTDCYVYGKPSIYLNGTIVTDEEIDAYKAQLLALINERNAELELLKQQRERLLDIAMQLEDVASENTQSEIICKLDILIESVSSIGSFHEITEEEANQIMDEIDNDGNN